MLDVKFILAIISLTLFGHDNIVISMKINTPRIMLNPISSEVINLTQAWGGIWTKFFQNLRAFWTKLRQRLIMGEMFF